MGVTRQILRSDAAGAYVRDVLSQGRSLSRRLINRDFAQGQIWTYLRRDAPLDYASAHLHETSLVATDEEAEPWKVVHGHRIRAKPTNLRPVFVDLIAQLMMRTPCTCCVFEDALAKSTDPILNTPPVSSEPYIFHSGDIFYLLDPDTSAPEAITTGMIRTASAWVQNIFLTLMPSGVEHISPGTEITDQELSALAANVSTILVSAFDGVGYVVWERPPR